MKHAHINIFFGCLLIVLLLGAGVGIAQEPQWIQSDERLVGENSPDYEDTLNRAAKEIWQELITVTDDVNDLIDSFISEHDPDGTHDLDLAAHPGEIIVKASGDTILPEECQGQTILIPFGTLALPSVDAVTPGFVRIVTTGAGISKVYGDVNDKFIIDGQIGSDDVNLTIDPSTPGDVLTLLRYDDGWICLDYEGYNDSWALDIEEPF